jgi:hypothetical protein
MTKRVMARGARATTTATKRAMAMAARAMATAMKSTITMNREGNVDDGKGDGNGNE